MAKIGILLFDEVEELDFVGPLEVFGIAGRLGIDCQTVLIGAEPGEIECRYGLRVRPQTRMAEAPRLDLLIVPGGPGARGRAREDQALRAFILTHTGPVASVCTGALILASAGLLEGRKATTHRSAIELLQTYPGVDVQEDVRIVFDGPVATSGGISAGIDLALALVARLWDVDLARSVAHRLEWDGAGRWEEYVARAAPPR